jgi:hypothetical protein
MTKGDIIRKLISEKFASKAQQRFFYAMANKDTKKGRKFKKWAKEFSDDTDFDDLPEKVSEEEKETKNPKMKKGDLVEYINSKKMMGEQRRGNRPIVVPEISGPDFRIVVQWLEKLRESGVINMFGCSPMLNWTEKDLHRWLYGQKQDPESIEEQIEELEYENEDGDNDSDIEMLENQLETINYLLENKQAVRDVLIRTALTRVENTDGNYETKNVQRIFERLAKEVFIMWTEVIYGNF